MNIGDDQQPDFDTFKYNAPPKTIQLSGGTDITVVSSGIASIDTVNALKVLKTVHNIKTDHYSIQDLSELDLSEVEASALRTSTLIIIDNDIGFCGINSQIIAKLPRTYCQTLGY